MTASLSLYQKGLLWSFTVSSSLQTFQIHVRNVVTPKSLSKICPCPKTSSLSKLNRCCLSVCFLLPCSPFLFVLSVLRPPETITQNHCRQCYGYQHGAQHLMETSTPCSLVNTRHFKSEVFIQDTTLRVCGIHIWCPSSLWWKSCKCIWNC